MTSPFPSDPQERAAIWPLLGLTALFGTGLLTASVSGYSLLLQRVGPGGLTPVLLIAAAVGVSYGWLDGRLSRRSTLAVRIWTLSAGSGVVALAAAALEIGTETVVVALAVPILCEVASVEAQKLVFELAALRFDIRQSKRLLGLAGAGRWVAYFVFGTVLWVSGDLIPVPVVLLTCAIAFVGAGMLGGQMASGPGRRAEGESAPPADSPTSPATSPEVAATRSRPLLRLIAGQIVLVFLVSITANYIFLERADVVVAAASLPSLFGAVGAAEGLITLLFSVLLSGPLLARLGVASSLTSSPVLLGGLTTGLLLMLSLDQPQATMGLAIALRLAERALRNGLARPAISILYQPLDPAIARARRSQLEGPFITVLYAAGSLVMGAILLSSAAAILLASVMLSLLALWLVLNRVTARGYIQALRRGLDRRELGAGMTLDADLRDLLAERLVDPDPLRALAAASLLSGFPDTVAQATDGLLTHPDARLRRIGIETARREGVVVPDHLLRRIATDGADEIGTRTLALATALDQGEEWAVAHAQAAISDGAAEGAVALMSSSGQRGIGEAGRGFLTNAVNGSSRQRREASLALSVVPSPAAQDHIVALAGEADPAIAIGVLLTGPLMDHPELWDVVVGRTGETALQPAASRALETGGEGAVPSIVRALKHPVTARTTRWRLARILVTNRSSAAIDAALDLLGDADGRVRAATLSAFGQQRPTLSPDQADRLCGQLRQTADLADSLVRMAEKSSGLFHDAVCAALLRERSALIQGLRALGADEEGRGMLSALESADPRLRASRLELLEQVIAPAERPLIKALEAVVDDGPADGMTRWPSQRPPPDAWIALLSRMGQDQDVLTTIERVIALRTTEIFGASPPEVLLDVAEQMQDATLAAGEQLFDEGDDGDRLYVLIEGEVSIRVAGVEVNRLHPGQAFGELALLEPEPRAAAAVAVTDAVLLSLGGETFEALLIDRPEVARAVMRYLAARLRAVTVRTKV